MLMSRTWDVALDAGSLTKIGIGVVLALVVVGFLISLLITAIVVRVLIAVVVIVLAAVVWQQRSAVLDKLDRNTCRLQASFFGVTVSAPDDVKRYCRRHVGGARG